MYRLPGSDRYAGPRKMAEVGFYIDEIPGRSKCVRFHSLDGITTAWVWQILASFQRGHYAPILQSFTNYFYCRLILECQKSSDVHNSEALFCDPLCWRAVTTWQISRPRAAVIAAVATATTATRHLPCREQSKKEKQLEIRRSSLKERYDFSTLSEPRANANGGQQNVWRSGTIYAAVVIQLRCWWPK